MRAGAVVITAANLATLHAAFDGVDLDERDERFLEWFAGWASPTCQRLVSLFKRAGGVSGANPGAPTR